ncbi:MAG: PepSY-associated TM helix domain-containing protein [Gemmatimonadota bacterium]
MHGTVKNKSAGAAARQRRLRDLAKWSFHLHLWLGVLSTGVLIVVAVTGILLNHKRPLGLMPDVPNEVKGAFENALSLAQLAGHAAAAVGPGIAGAGVDRMDVRPGDGLIKIRYNDRVVTEATVDINTGAVLHVGARNDVFLEKLHSGEIFGSNWILLTDVAAVLLVVVLITGYWLWLYPKTSR